MNREIKFRGKIFSFEEDDYKYEGEWVYGYLYINPFGDHYISTSILPVVPESVGQFTGLCDKNGKEIYEGDVLKNDKYEKPFNVEFIEGSFSGYSYGYLLKPSMFPSSTIVGNIYDNPELLHH